MNNQRVIKTLLWGLLVVLWLSGCNNPTDAPSPTHTSTTSVPLSGVTATAQSTPYSSPTLAVLHTATPTATSTPTPTNTPTPTSTPTPTLTPTPICSETHGRLETGTYFSQILGHDMVYKVYLPPCYDVYTAHEYPTLYLLHGHPFDESHWDNLGVDEAADTGINSEAYPPFIIVMPDCDSSADGIFVNTSGGDNSVEGLIVNELLPHIDATYRTWANRQGRAIGGISRGGVWSLEIAFRHPDLFSAVGAHSPALSVNYPHPLYDPFNLLTEPGVRQLRIYLDAGDADWARVGADRLHRALEEEGLPHEFTIGEGDHVDDYWSRMTPAYLAFYTLAWPMIE